jgi:ATP-dependent Clp protease ATP-binding subunit ClpC
MQGYNFTEQVRRTLAQAREEAGALNHEYVGTEHILLGLLRETKGVVADVMRSLSVDVETTRQVVIDGVKKGRGFGTGPDLPYTSRGKKSLELAMMQAHEWGHSYIGAEHLLVGLVREQGGIAAQVLAQAGVTIDNVRTATLACLGEEHLAEPKAAEPPSAVRGVVVEIHRVDGTMERREFSDSREAIVYLVRHQ